jgi:hypothetical protein
VPPPIRGFAAYLAPPTRGSMIAYASAEFPERSGEERVNERARTSAPILQTWLIYPKSKRVTDGARTRDLRSHNPSSSVAGVCTGLRIPHI